MRPIFYQFEVLFFILAAVINSGYAIINGVSIDIKNAPWQVSVRDVIGHICGGSILSEVFVITSAHCVHDKNLPAVKYLYVLSGTNNRMDTNSKNIIPVLQKIIHGDFQFSKNDHDIALLKLKAPLALSLTKQPINLPTRKYQPNSNVVTTGWGQTSRSENTLSTLLLKLDTVIYGENMINMKFPTFKMERNRIYTFSGLNSGISNGDSGGPLALGNYLIGIVERYIPGSLDVYVDIFAYKTWIITNMNLNPNYIL